MQNLLLAMALATIVLLLNGVMITTMNRFIAGYLQKRGLQVSKRKQDGFSMIK